MKFTKEFLQENLYDESGLVEDRITSHDRWSVTHRRIFKFEDRFYVTFYRCAATEYQDEQPYEYDPAEIECKEVFPVPSIEYK